MGKKPIAGVLAAAGASIALACSNSPLQAQGATLVSPASAAAEGAPERLVLEDFPGALVDKVVVPVPGEIFAVMDKLGAPDWSGELHAVGEGLSNDRVVLSLDFGATIAEGFLAVQAEEPEAVKDLGRRLLRLASALAIEDRVLPHYQSIIDATDVGEWRQVRSEIDRTQQTVRRSMVELRDGELATLVSLGGWLRGTEALTSLIADAYNTDRAELLHQPDLVVHFVKTVGEMPTALRSNSDVEAISEGLSAIHQAMTEGQGQPGTPAKDGEKDESAIKSGSDADEVVVNSEVSAGSDVIGVEQVKRINAICSELLDRFYASSDAAGSGSKADSKKGER